MTASSEQGVEGDRAADGDRRGAADGPSVGRDGHDHEHEERGHHHLVHESGSRADAGHRRSEVGRRTFPDDPQKECAADSPRQLRRYVGSGVADREVAG